MEQRVYDPRGIVEAKPRPIAARVAGLDGLRLGVLNNTKWNASRLLALTTERLQGEARLAGVNLYEKESFSKNAAPELIERIAAENDIVLTAIGD
jgi:hypothetical protein